MWIRPHVDLVFPMLEFFLIISGKIVFVGLLFLLLVFTDRPFVSAVIYTSAKMGTVLLLAQLDYFAGNETDNAHFGTVFFLFGVLNLFGSFLVAGVFCKYRFESWVRWVCLILAVPLLLV